ncbi:LysR family transcriptional regulator [Fictibacillus sp. KU28468]|uniref:LysR family transcriptional regulator n=1 Tax=Fictibacillus sp. KU28468 TaxID=2991053 RepID=UPI00223E7AE5|nr:LysR family transcriptional regulator [Fictibacillus sp. KU28468]UZJ79357.1 LysR family transcriptional regulator [Fictibacillus sp. KU28468]
MDLKQLRYFTAIAQEGQITRAAKRLNMSQPPLSQQLQLMEQELGVLLMERNGRNMELTEAGKVLYEKANKLLDQMDETITEVKEIGEGLKGELSIGSVKTCFSYIPERLRHFREHYPQVTFRLQEGDSFRLAQSLRKREIELAIVRLPLELNDFSSIELPTDNFVVVVPENSSMESTIPMKELAPMPLMLLHRVSGVGLYELVINAWKSHGYEPTVVCQCPDAAMLLSLVKAGVGVALLPSSTLLAFPAKGLKVVELEDCKIESKSAVIWLKDRYLSRAAVRFLEMFEDR